MGRAFSRAALAAIAIAACIAPTGGLLSAQGPARGPRVTGISHVALRVSDVAASRVFYGGMLGFAEGPAAGAGRILFTVGSSQTIALEPGLRHDQDERLSHIAYATPDLDALARHLRSRGVEVTQPPDRCEEAAIRAFDPDGHTIEFVQRRWPPDVAPAASAPGALSNRILHAGAIVADETRAHGLYRDTLGFLEIWRGGRPEGVTRWVNMRVPDGTDYLEYMLAASPPDRRERGVMHHVCLRVPDMQEAWEEVSRRAARFAATVPGPPQIGVNGRYQLNLYDPDGTRVELMEPYRVR